uniref:Putative GT2: Lipopolysaccharide core biosynthesis glycosyltransferase waaE n=1 Tax=Magnetococcus massalia (strain MO-1) TaxID=451514 RepID=A0A1S7LGK1_MAGMO|nr:putative GT2 : Lipopolysaccharide core biosynthesis glycosyltransferase waaE [Candidatus Magnetococcus massalia]
MRRLPISGVIITLNEAHRLEACLATLQFCQEILVVDSGSNDQTVAVAEASGARVVVQSWLGYGAQKQFAIDQAQNDWVLCLDADEQLEEALQQEIIERFSQGSPEPGVAFEMPRRNRFMGRWLNHGEGYPDPNLRLFNRQQGRWSQDPVHEHVTVDGTVERLRGAIRHQSEESLEHYLAKQNRYTTLQAKRLVAQGKKVGLTKLLISPLLRFLKFYLLRLGFLDGLPGLVHISIGCMNSHLKYAKAWAMQQRAAEK